MSDDILDALDDYQSKYALLVNEATAIARAVTADDPYCMGIIVRGMMPRPDLSVKPVFANVPEGAAPKKSEHAWQYDRPMMIELIARMTAIRSMRFNPDTQSFTPYPESWRELVAATYKGKFDCEMAIGAGWADLLIAMTAWLDERGEVPSFSQIKEKFGGLRLYTSHAFVRDTEDLVTMAEHVADDVCEECGAPGRVRKRGWIRTLCDVHAAEKR